MARYRIDDTVIDTANSTAHYEEATFHDGRNLISKATGSQWTHQDLYRSRRGRYYVVHTSQIQGSRDTAEWVSEHEAARWLLANDHKLPEELRVVGEEVSE